MPIFIPYVLFFKNIALKNKYMRVSSTLDHLAFFFSLGPGSPVGYLICSLLELIDRYGDKYANDMQIDTLGQFFVNRIAAYVHRVLFNNGLLLFKCRIINIHKLHNAQA